MDCERWVDPRREGDILLFERVFLSGRPAGGAELEELVCCTAVDGGGLGRAREDRRMVTGSRVGGRGDELWQL